ncbi:hypothetical protein [Haloarcula sp. JP-L23]|uniref:hypothetical protein n=1 Tax=Haloarcula sp. JP-L23 TaxID=2716717 RepID=UPI00140F47D8|nr:hypothetical protein G9465_01700 [Haloarcula sp. JP-L23]
MSSASPFQSPSEALPDRSVDFRTLAFRPIQFLGFWTAVLAPLAYPTVLLSGLDGQSLLFLLAGVFLANVLGLVLGRDYRTDA